MDKDSLLTAITHASAERSISREELLSAFQKGQGEIAVPQRSKLNIINILYALGGLIVVIGIILFFEQQWETLSSTARILVTLGSGIATYLAGILFMRVKSFTGVAVSFFLIFVLVSPFGIHVTLDTLDYASPILSNENIIFSTMFIWTLASFSLLRLSIFRTFSVIFGSLLFFSSTGALLERNPAIDIGEAFEYRFLLLGISYALLAYSWKKIAPTLSSWMYALGTMMFLSAALALGGYAPSANKPWEIAYIGLNFGILFLSVVLKSRAMLVLGSLYLMGYIMKITAEYFSDSLGWPISLVLAGFTLIGIGYVTFMMNQRFMKKDGVNLDG
ncbi:MAG: DUF2157 domain-containing protein [bacterium]|nr:DUF2157 domain-containing protein [bacterium]